MPCDKSPNGSHYPNPESVTRDKNAAPFVLDVACMHCGRSGSFVLTPSDINWD